MFPLVHSIDFVRRLRLPLHLTTRQVKVVGWSALLTSAVVVLWIVASTSRPPALIVRAFTAKEEAFANPKRNFEYLVATIELTNASKRPIAYWAFPNGRPAVYALLHQTPVGWKDTMERRWVCGTGLKECRLAPAQSIAFDAVVDPDKPCKVAIHYYDGRARQPWQWLPRFLARRMPRSSDGGTVTTDVIDLRGDAGRAVRRPNPMINPQKEGANDK